MNNKNFLSISEFSKISSVSRKTLIYYDNSGLFHPSRKDANGYRYYAHEQIYQISTIQVLIEVGLSHDEIKEYLKKLSPSDAISMIDRQRERLTEMINSFTELKNMLNLKKTNIKEALENKEGFRIVRIEKDEMIDCGENLDKNRFELKDEDWINFYISRNSKNIPFGYNEGFVLDRESIEQGQYNKIRSIVSYTGSKKNSNAVIKHGIYAEYLFKGNLDDSMNYYPSLISKIKENGLKIAGPSYEKRLIDETGSEKRSEQVVKILIPVE